tara:strand:+ start:4873 stop:5451 length:579 start_codon:yes stop_codon:yes gene_type:complete
MSYYLPKNLKGSHAVCGFSRCGNVFLNRKIRLNSDIQIIDQHYHSAAYGNILLKKDVNVLFIIRDPKDCILSNKVYYPHLTITSIYLSYILYLFKIKGSKYIIDFSDFTNNSSKFQTMCKSFIGENNFNNLPSDKEVKKWILSEKDSNNEAQISAPTPEKEAEKSKYIKQVENHFLRKVSYRIYNSVMCSIG